MKHGGHTFESQKSLSYLGVQVDTRCNFREHTELVAKRASETCRRLHSLLPNSKGPRQMMRRLLASVVLSRLLYGAPFWIHDIVKGAINKLSRVARRMMLRVAICYRTTSYAAVAVVASVPPLELLAKERAEIYGGLDRALARSKLLRRWQEECDTARTGRWTYRLMGDMEAWYRRRHSEVNFHMSQVLTGHGFFRSYLQRFGKSDTDACALCGVSPDDAEHAIFACELAHRWRNEACVYLGIGVLTPDNLVSVMLS